MTAPAPTNSPTFTEIFEILPATLGATSDVSLATRLPVAWMVDATSRSSLLPTVIAIAGCPSSALALEFARLPRPDPDPPHETAAISTAINRAQANDLK